MAGFPASIYLNSRVTKTLRVSLFYTIRKVFLINKIGGGEGKRRNEFAEWNVE